jgi:hypothetical protein
VTREGNAPPRRARHRCRPLLRTSWRTASSRRARGALWEGPRRESRVNTRWLKSNLRKYCVKDVRHSLRSRVSSSKRYASTTHKGLHRSLVSIASGPRSSSRRSAPPPPRPPAARARA